jgi:hypothetical protein
MTSSGWKLDKHIPITLVVLFIGQIATFAWYAAKMDSRMYTVEAAQVAESQERKDMEVKQEEARANTDKKLDDMNARLIKIEAHVELLLPKKPMLP